MMSITKTRLAICSLGLLVLLSPALFAQISGARHDKEFWKQIVHNDYHVPSGESVAVLTAELSDDLGSSDPELRDDLAYEISATWIYRDGLLSGSEVQALVQKCERNLRSGLGDSGTDSTLLRSFSALELSVIAAVDNKKAVLSDTGFQELVLSAINYMNAERDLRGYDPQKGWIHATAHTADLLKFLGRNTRLKASDEVKILDAVTNKIHQGGRVFVFGENERMAAAVLSLIERKDFDQRGFENWLDRFAADGEAVWATPHLDVSLFASVQNAKDLLRSLLAQMYSIEHAGPNVEWAKTTVLICLKHMR